MIAPNAYEIVINEYNEKRLYAARVLKERRARIEMLVPQLKEIEDEIANYSVNSAISRIRKSSSESDDYTAKLNELHFQKLAYLEKAGFTEKDLLPDYQCPVCRDTGYVDGQLCSCFKARLVDILYDQSDIKDILKDENFNTFSYKYYSGGESLSVAERAVESAHCFIDNFANSADNLFITGKTGVGKTFLTNCIAKEIIDQGFVVVYLSAIRLFDILSDAAFGVKKYDSEGELSAQLSKRIFSCDLLIIDDLGTELNNTFTSSQLFNCINERILSRKHTIISTNLSLKQIQENYSERVSSRIIEKYTMIKLIGEDIRILKKLGK